MGIGLPEILIVLLIVVVVFGARKLPELGRGLGSGMREFKDGIQGKDEDAALAPPAQQAAPAQQQAAEPQPVAPPVPVAPAEPAPPAPPRTEE
jgi:TatA/E family protein of Tat protein translocase